MLRGSSIGVLPLTLALNVGTDHNGGPIAATVPTTIADATYHEEPHVSCLAGSGAAAAAAARPRRARPQSAQATTRRQREIMRLRAEAAEEREKLKV